MTLLAIDTATDNASVALYSVNGVVAEQTWRAHREQTAQLVPVMQSLMRYVGLTPGELSAVAAAVGPGSFNGLRVGLSTAKAIATALGLPLYGLSNLDSLAYQHADISTRMVVWAAVQVGRGRLAVASYRTSTPRGGSPEWRRTSDYRNVSLAELSDLITAPSYIVGELSPAMAQELEARNGDLATIAPPAAALRRAAYIAELAWRRKQRGDLGDNIADLQAIYLASPSPSAQQAK